MGQLGQSEEKSHNRGFETPDTVTYYSNFHLVCHKDF